MIRYDGRADALYIRLAEGAAESQFEVKPGVIMHQGPSEEFVGVEIRDASRHIPLKDLGRLILGESANRGEFKAVFELPKRLDRESYDGLIEATRAEGWEVAPARRRQEWEAMLAASTPKALLFVRRKQPA
jgi:uncharacterized protein YuzE